ncbi:MAG TPA: chemotaxis protein CheD, partial [Bacillales bacterium]|nr:chemotaxis protein CheD [Bacillales bacterium]
MNNTLSVEKVGIADMKIVKAPHCIRTSGLGSCVGVVIYDFGMKLAGMAHVMLPESSLAKGDGFNPAKYADTAVQTLISQLIANGAKQGALKAKIAGGAQMFQFTVANELMRIGPRNVEAVKKELSRLHVQLISEEVGGNRGRTIEFNPTNGMLLVKSVNYGLKEI